MTTDQTATGFGLPSEKRIGFDHPWAWLAAGYRDMKRSPHVSLSYGALFAAMGCLLTYGPLRAGSRLRRAAAWRRASC